MILEELTIHNFGLFKGTHSLTFGTPSTSRPITLIGGLNGSGKTTLLDALQLVLFGNRARLSNRGTLSYDEYLRRSINSEAAPQESFVALRFRKTVNGQNHLYQMTRSWSAKKRVLSDALIIERNGIIDRHLSDHGLDFIEEIVPAEIAQLFFFDGEKIEQFAEPISSQQLIARAIGTLLGLDVVTRLEADLTTLERRKQIAAKTDVEQQEIHGLEKDLESHLKRREELTQQRAAYQNDLDRRKKQLRDVEELYKKSGGESYDKRHEIETRRRQLAERLNENNRLSADAAEGTAPLLLVRDLLNSIRAQHEKEIESDKNRIVREQLVLRDIQLIETLDSIGLKTAQKKAIKHFLDEDLRGRVAYESLDRYLHLSEDAGRDLREMEVNSLQETEKEIRSFLRADSEIKDSILDADRALASIPAEDVVSGLSITRLAAIDALGKAIVDVEEMDLTLEQLASEISSVEDRLSRLYESSIADQFETEDIARVVEYSSRVRETLKSFRRAVAAHHIERISSLMLDSFQRIIRKSQLVSDLFIEPQTLTIELRNGAGRTLSPDRLSAGERQLLAVSLLWGLARASGFPLPVVIDTPLGRLDSTHRGTLVENYFPHASHQVVLLSTDKEIEGRLYDELKPFINKSYRLDYDEDEKSSQIVEGYLPLRGAAGSVR